MMTSPSLPWPKRLVDLLNRYQNGGYMHPFTCPRKHKIDVSHDLLATENGWVCHEPDCDYTQATYHDFMCDETYMDAMDELRNKARIKEWD